MKVKVRRRRPVPRDWREDHHWLNAYSHRNYGVVRGSGYYSRAGGTCSCGETFGLAANKHTMNAAAVRDAWLDHVEDAWLARHEEA